MTCIVGLVDRGAVWIGGDSAGVEGLRALSLRADQKVFVNGAIAMGFTGSFRMGQLLRYKLSPPRRHPDDDLFSHLVGPFVDEVRKVLKAGGFAHKENEVESGGRFLIGTEGRLFMVDGDYQVGESMDGYDAVGCGDSFALGALYATRRGKVSPRRRVTIALEAAEAHNPAVRRPFHIVKTGG